MYALSELQQQQQQQQQPLENKISKVTDQSRHDDIVEESFSKKPKIENEWNRPSNSNSKLNEYIGAPARILSRRYPLTKTAYKYLDIGITIGHPLSFVEIILGDCHGKELSFSPETWKELMELRQILLPYFRGNDREDDRRSPPPIQIGGFSLRFSKINNLRILRLETPKVRLAISGITVFEIFNLKNSINRIIKTLTSFLNRIDGKLARYREIAANIMENSKIPAAIMQSEYYDEDDIIDCELQAVLFKDIY